MDSTTALKGFAALLVLVHHIAMNTDGGILNQMNYPSVAVFFMVSGYCTMYGYLQKTHYVRQILTRKIPLLLVWCLFSIILTCIFYAIVGEPVSITELIHCVTGNRVLNWYFMSLVLKYLIFVLVVTLCRIQDVKIVVLFLAIGVYMVVCRVVGAEGSWYCSSLAFPMGAACAVYFPVIQQWIIEKYKSGVLLTLVLFGLSYAGVYLGNGSLFMRLLHLACQLVSSLAFATLLFLIFSNKKSKYVFNYCGRHSAQIIFAQSICLVMFRNSAIYVENDIVYALLSIFLVAVYVFVTSPAYKALEKMINLRTKCLDIKK